MKLFFFAGHVLPVQMEGLQFDNEELRHETEVLRNQVSYVMRFFRRIFS